MGLRLNPATSDSFAVGATVSGNTRPFVCGDEHPDTEPYHVGESGVTLIRQDMKSSRSRSLLKLLPGLLIQEVEKRSFGLETLSWPCFREHTAERVSLKQLPLRVRQKSSK